MVPDDLQLIHFSTEVLYPPLQEIERTTLTQLYAALSRRHGYPSFALVQNGAVLSDGVRSVFRVQMDRVFIQEERPRYAIEFYRQNCHDLIQTAQRHIAMPIFLVQSVTLRVLTPCRAEGQDAVRFIGSRLLRITEEQFGRLGRPLAGVGLRLRCPGEHNVFEIRLEPFYQNPKEIFIEVVAQFLQPTPSLEDVTRRIDEVYAFICGPVGDFLESLIVEGAVR